MAAGPLLGSEPLQRYRALGVAGDPVWRAAGQLRAAIAQRLSREHADLLAIPEVDPSGQRIDWYAAFDGEARRLERSRRDGTHRGPRQGAQPARRSRPPGRRHGSAGALGCRAQFRAPAAPRADRARRRDTLRRRRQAGDDLLGLRRRLGPARRFPGDPARSAAPAPQRCRKRSWRRRRRLPCRPRCTPAPARSGGNGCCWRALLLACSPCSPGWSVPICRTSSRASKPKPANVP